MRQVSNPVGFPSPLPGQATVWHLAHGHHPGLPGIAGLLSLLKADAADSIPEGLPLLPGHRGHHLMQDEAYLAAAGQTDTWPLAPLYVRDLAGRILHTGLNPLPLPPSNPLTPETCTPLAANQAGVELLEKVFLMELRRLELAVSPGLKLDHADPAAAPRRALYATPQHYPYKLRPDTFYQDGFRLPQVERLHVQPAAPALAQAVAEEFLQRWQQRPKGQEYEEFYEKNGGAEWFESLFQQGCTIIPTTESYNGWYQVTPDFGMADVMPGRAIAGLHEVTAQEASSHPQGTILRVVQPGYATRHRLVPAQVVVSNGKDWKHPYPAEPEPFLPDLTLPHPRVGHVAEGDQAAKSWGRVWLPTHPGHFVQPALWDWSETGNFVQMSGPLWDPVHYVYASTSKILRALRRHPHGLAPVPEDMGPRFHPVIEPATYDTHNSRTLSERKRSLPEEHLLQASALDALPLGRSAATLGYHPLPVALEYELDPAAMPHLGPQRFGPCPPQLAERRLRPIHSAVTGTLARQHTVVLTEPETILLLNPDLYTEQPQTYPQLQRGYGGENDGFEATRAAALMPVFLPEREQAELFANIRRMFSRVGYHQQLAALHPDLPQRLQAFIEEAHAWRRRRYRAWRRFLPGLLQAWWSFQVFEIALATPEEEGNSPLRAVILAQQPTVKAVAPTAPTGLPGQPNSPKLKAD